MKLKLSKLLSQRETLLRQARLANLAYGYSRLEEFVARIDRARLSGAVRLKQAPPGSERIDASLAALTGNQSVIEEHFTDEDVSDLADIIAFMTGESDLNIAFAIEDLGRNFLDPLRRELKQLGVAIDRRAPRRSKKTRRARSSDCPQADESA